jgi:oligoribonuclease
MAQHYFLWNTDTMQDKHNLIWIDLEMTGLNFEQDKIIEIATIITDSSLNTIAEGPVIAIHQPDSLLDNMDKWNTKHHNESGLVARVKESAYSMEQAEAETLAFIKKYVPAKKSPLCGNSICTDRRFLYTQMPSIDAHLHYRHIDVSTIKELAMRWKPEIVKEKKSAHLALQDIKDSIEELKYLREHFIDVE